MKRIILALVLSLCCVGTHLQAMNIYHAMCHNVVGFGQFLDKIEVPLIDKLTHLLPFEMISAGCKKCPGQTMLVTAGLLYYVLSQNASVRSFCNKYKKAVLKRFNMYKEEEYVDFDDTLFVFDDEDLLDAEEEMEMEDELLEDSFNDDLFKPIKRKKIVNFL